MTRPTTLGERLTRLREGAGLSQLEMANRMDYHPATISFWERDRRAPSLMALCEIADAFGVTLDWLARGRTMQDRNGALLIGSTRERRENGPAVKESQIAEVHRLRADGLSTYVIADQVGVSQGSVSHWLRGLHRAPGCTPAGGRAGATQ